MKEFGNAIETSYQIAFSKYDKELVSALESAEAILSEHKKELNSEQLCKVYLTISICKIKMDYTDDFLPLLLLAESHALKTGSKTLLGRALNLQANYMMRTGHLQDSVQKLLNLLEIVDDDVAKISNLNNLGLVYISLGLFDKALECMFESLRICEKSNDSRGYLRSCVNIGICYYDIHNYEKSLEYFQAAQKISVDFPEDESKMFLTINLGLNYAYLNEFDRALDLLQEAQAMESDFEFVKHKGSLIYNIGEVYELKKDFDAALTYYNEALSIMRNTPNIILLVPVLNSIAGIYIIQEEYSKAEELLNETLGISSENYLPLLRSVSLNKLAMLFKQTGQYQKALEYHIEFHNLNESIFNEKVKFGVIKYESDYLAEKLEQKAEIFRLQNVELVEKNDIISQKQHLLEEALARLSESNDTKDKLFSIIAHDLRGPVAALQMSLQCILSTKCSKASQDKMLSNLNEQTKNTFVLLENLLWWSQIQKEGLYLNMEQVEINQVIETAINVYRTIAETKGIGLDITLSANVNVMADREALSLILRNLISNAIKYSKQGSSIKLISIQSNGKITIEITDAGKGINPAIVKAIESNKRIQSLPGTDSEKGMGLGLSLCYEFASRMNGKIQYRNEYTSGTCFVLELPLV